MRRTRINEKGKEKAQKSKKQIAIQEKEKSKLDKNVEVATL